MPADEAETPAYREERAAGVGPLVPQLSLPKEKESREEDAKGAGEDEHEEEEEGIGSDTWYEYSDDEEEGEELPAEDLREFLGNTLKTFADSFASMGTSSLLW